MLPTDIYDSSRRLDVGDFVRTSPIYNFEAGFISVYLFMGDGLRKIASLDAVASLF